MPLLLLLGVGGGWYATNKTVENVTEASNGVNWTLIILVVIAAIYAKSKGVF